MSKRKPARVAARVLLPAELQIADDMLIEQRIAVKFLQQVESYVRLVFFERFSDWCQVARQADRLSFVTHALECGVDVKLGLPELDLLLGVTLEGIRRNQVLLHQNDDPYLSFTIRAHKATRG